jgi:hypothetical protein
VNAAARSRLSLAMSALFAASALYIAARDVALPDVRETEVWFGVALRGRAAQLTAPLHWALLAAGAWAWWTQRAWAARATSLYLAYVALSHAIWSALNAEAEYARASLVLAAACAALAIPFWRKGRLEPAR